MSDDVPARGSDQAAPLARRLRARDRPDASSRQVRGAHEIGVSSPCAFISQGVQIFTDILLPYLYFPGALKTI